MRFVRHAALASVVAAVAAGTAPAQLGGSTTGGSTGSSMGGSTGSSSSAFSNTGSSSGSGSSGSSGSGSGTGTTVTPQITGGEISALSSTATSTTTAIDKSNFLGASYSNPYYQGLYSNTNGGPGGFGTNLFGTGGSSGTTTGSTSTRTTTGSGRTTTGGANPFGTSGSPFGTTGGQGGRGGQAGGFGSAATSQFGGQVIPLSRNIAYTASMRFASPTIAPAQRLADVQAVLSRSSQFSTPAGVNVVQDGTVFVLRGAVGSEDEARLAEGMIRLTPGVREVRNELVYPKQ